jgi:hypothetical protein
VFYLLKLRRRARLRRDLQDLDELSDAAGPTSKRGWATGSSSEASEPSSGSEAHPLDVAVNDGPICPGCEGSSDTFPAPLDRSGKEWWTCFACNTRFTPRSSFTRRHAMRGGVRWTVGSLLR